MLPNMKNNSQKTQFSYSIIFFLVSFSVFLFLYFKVDNTERLSAQKLKEWRVESARRNEIKSLENLMKENENERVSIETHFAQSSNPVPFLDTIEKLAGSVNVKSEVSSVDIAKEGDALIIGMNATGTFEALYKFLTLLENSPYGLEFLSMDVQTNIGYDTSSKQTGDWSAVFKIKLLTFVQ